MLNTETSTAVICAPGTNTHIIFKKIDGVLTAIDIISWWEELINKELIKSSLRAIIVDYRKAKMQLSLKDIYKITQFYKSNKHLLESFRIANILTTQNIVFKVFFESAHLSNFIKAFETKRAAMNWITLMQIKPQN